MTDIDHPSFTAAELARIAGLDRRLVDVWVHRGLIKPARVGQLTSRGRAMFSIAGIFEATLIRLFSECLAIGPAAAFAARAAVDDGNWLRSIALKLDLKKPPLDLRVTVCRREKCWQAIVHVGDKPFSTDFGPDAIFAVIPYAAIFTSVYNECRATLSGEPKQKKRGKTRRG